MICEYSSARRCVFFFFRYTRIRNHNKQPHTNTSNTLENTSGSVGALCTFLLVDFDHHHHHQHRRSPVRLPCFISIVLHHLRRRRIRQPPSDLTRACNGIAARVVLLFRLVPDETIRRTLNNQFSTHSAKMMHFAACAPLFGHFSHLSPSIFLPVRFANICRAERFDFDAGSHMCE